VIELVTDLDKVQPWVRAALYKEAFERTTHLSDAGKAIVGDLDKRRAYRARIVLQKSVLLMERLLGLSGGHFRYCWDIIGPYSTELADSADQLRILIRLGYGIPDDVSEEQREEIRSAAQDVDRAAGSRPDELPEDEWMELLASIVYLRSDEPDEWSPLNKDSVCQMLRDNGKSFCDDHIVQAIETLNDLFGQQRG